jgi:hypothetical protein
MMGGYSLQKVLISLAGMCERPGEVLVFLLLIWIIISLVVSRTTSFLRFVTRGVGSSVESQTEV